MQPPLLHPKRKLAVCLSPIPWAGLWTSRHELCRELARRGWRVLFVDPPANALRPPRAGDPRRAPEGIEVLTPPPHLPYGVLGRAGWLARAVIDLNARRYAAFVDRAVARAGARSVDLLLNSFMPVIGYRVGERVRSLAHVYQRADELRSYPSYRPYYSQLEERLARRADVVVCVSPAVREGIAGARPDAHLLPNGVDTARFVGARPDPVVAAIAAAGSPIAALVGTIDRRVDVELIEAAGRAATVVVAGPVSDIELPPGVVALGPVPPERIPAILAAADVGLVCYQPSWSGDVLKIYEYLAAGLPVVAGDHLGMHATRAWVDVVSSPAEMTRAVSEAVASAPRRAAKRSDDAAASIGPDQRRAAAAGWDWTVRVDALLALAGLSQEERVGA